MRTFLVLAMALCTSACSSRLTPEFARPTGLPKAHISIANQTQAGTLVTFCWGGACSDGTLRSPAEALSVPQNFEMTIVLDAQPAVRDVQICTIAVDKSMMHGQTESGEIVWEAKSCDFRPIEPAKSQSIPMRLSVGRHVIFLASWWVGGDAFFGFTADVSPK